MPPPSKTNRPPNLQVQPVPPSPMSATIRSHPTARPIPKLPIQNSKSSFPCRAHVSYPSHSLSRSRLCSPSSSRPCSLSLSCPLWLGGRMASPLPRRSEIVSSDQPITSMAVSQVARFCDRGHRSSSTCTVQNGCGLTSEGFQVRSAYPTPLRARDHLQHQSRITGGHHLPLLVSTTPSSFGISIAWQDPRAPSESATARSSAKRAVILDTKSPATCLSPRTEVPGNGPIPLCKPTFPFRFSLAQPVRMPVPMWEF